MGSVYELPNGLPIPALRDCPGSSPVPFKVDSSFVAGVHFMFTPKPVAVLHCFLRSHRCVFEASTCSPVLRCLDHIISFAIWEGLRKEPSVIF